MRLLYKIGLYLNIILHYIVFVCFVITVLFGWLHMPFYLYVTVSSLIIRVLVSRDICPLNIIENKFRKPLGMEPMERFVKEYVIHLPTTLGKIWRHK